MRIIDCEQGSEEWESWRARPTASCFDKFITPARGDYSKQATKYACEIVAKRLGVYIESVPTIWMELGTENEPNAAHAYEKQFGCNLETVGFVLPDHTDAFGCSPDRLVNVKHGVDGHATAAGMVEFKCPKAETLIQMHADRKFAELYSSPQVQGQLLVTQCPYADFYVWHPELEAFHFRIEPDLEYQAKIAEHMLTFLKEIERVEKAVRKQHHELVVLPTARDNLNWS